MITLPFIQVISDYLPALLGIIYFRRLAGSRRMAAAFFILVAAVDSFGGVLAQYHLHNMWLNAPFMLIEGIVLPYLALDYSGFKNNKTCWWLFSLIFTGYWLNAALRNDSLSFYDSEFDSIKTLSLLILSVVSLIKLRLSETKHLLKDERFIFLSALLITYSG